MKREPYVKNLPLEHQGKVRDTFMVPDHAGLRLMVATDAVSTYNVAHKSLIPDKGVLLTALSVFWMWEVFQDIPTHVVAFGKNIYEYLPRGQNYPDDLHLRALVIRRLDMVPFEFIFRARMAGSLWSSYKKGEPNPYGLILPPGLELMSLFDKLEFTPTEKSATDDPVNSEEVEENYPAETALMRQIYTRGRDFALNCGIDIIDFKGECGWSNDGVLTLGDEWLNSDCCRLVEADKIVVGDEPPWADKEIFRQDTLRQWKEMDGKPPLFFSEEVIKKGVDAYHHVFERITGFSLSDFQNHYLC